MSRAGQDFSSSLLLVPNGKSDIDGNPFLKPGEVYQALCWLATTYAEAKRGNARCADFNHSLREYCGWFYRQDQSEITVGRWRQWYEAQHNGRKYVLAQHIGTGSAKDPRHTIRIAFAWDAELDRVVVGYIGQHQRTSAT